MPTKNELVSEQLHHILTGTLVFVVIGIIAVLLDLCSSGLVKLGVSTFTYEAIVFAAHALLVVDLALFALYIVKTSIDLIKEIFK